MLSVRVVARRLVKKRRDTPRFEQVNQSRKRRLDFDIGTTAFKLVHRIDHQHLGLVSSTKR